MTYQERRGLLAFETGTPGKRGHFALYYCAQCGRIAQPPDAPICVLCRATVEPASQE